MARSANELMDANDGWHTGSGTITYSYIGSSMPAYYDEVDTDNDGVVDAHDVDGFDIPFTEDGAMSLSQRGMVEQAIHAWNEVANVNLVHGNAENGTGGTHGTPVTGNGTLVGGLDGEAGYGEILVSRNDDGYQNVDTSAVFEDGLNFYGTQSDGTDVFVNTNGNITFGQGLSTYTPSSISNQMVPMVAAFWGDVDTRVDSDEDTPDSGPIYVDVDAARDVVTFTWLNVGYYSTGADKTNSFQIQLYDRGNGDFDIVFRYEDINWTTGNASGGEGGLGGTPAHAGYTAGDGNSFFELPQSANQGAMLGLESTNGNTDTPGLWKFEVREGGIVGEITFGSFDMTTKTDGTAGDVEGFSYVGTDPNTASHAGDVWINSTATGLELGHNDWNTYLHEIGHSLGLDHPGGDGWSLDNSKTVMSYYAHPSVSELPEETQPWPITPMVLDIAELQEAYGANTSTRNTDTIYFGDGSGSATAELAYQYGADDMMLNGRSVIMTIWDAGGTDLIDASDITSAASIDLRPGRYSTIGSIEDNVATAKAVKVDGSVINLIENAIGTGLNDKIKGNQTANNLWGGDGNDKIAGLGANDVLYGGSGKDTIWGGSGKDDIYGGENGDKLRGEGGNDTLGGGAGNDLILGDKGSDQLFGGEGRDELVGGRQGDTLFGGDNADKLSGNQGNDILNGGAGNDKLKGGSGSDTFVFEGDFGKDRIYDFAEGDLIDLSAVASITGFSDLQANHMSQYRDGAHVLIDAGSDNRMLIRNTEVEDLGASDFIF